MNVLRLCSVFQPPASALTGRGARFDPIGGTHTHTDELTRALDALGVAQTVVTTYRPSAGRAEQLGRHARVVRLGLPVPWFRQLYSWPAALRLPRLAAGADLVHAHLGEDLAVVPLALRTARRHAVPLVLTVHTSVRHTLAVTGPRSALLAAAGGRLERHGIAAADAVIVLVPRLVDTLIRAAGELPDAQLIIAGDGPERATLHRLAHRLGLAGRVHFLGFVAHEKVPALLRAGDVLALPSRYEELGTALLEGMQVGLPIVASATGGVPQVVDDGRTGLLVPPGEPGALVSALRRVLADPTLAARLGAAARREVERYRWSDLAGRVLAIYHDVVDLSPAGPPAPGRAAPPRPGPRPGSSGSPRPAARTRSRR